MTIGAILATILRSLLLLRLLRTIIKIFGILAAASLVATTMLMFVTVMITSNAVFYIYYHQYYDYC